jgi:hypothetical protein
MESTKSEKELLPFLGFLAILKELLIRDGVAQIALKNICSQTFRRLISHFNSSLQNRSRETGAWVTCKPESKVLVNSDRAAHIIDNFFQSSEPADCQVTVLQNGPGAFFLSFLDHGVRDWSLALSKRNGLTSNFLVIREFQKPAAIRKRSVKY